MQNIPPWDNPAASSYCQAVNSWIYVDTTTKDACSTGPCQTVLYNIWSSDHVFCLPSAGDLWQLMLYLALVGWVFLTAISLLQTYEWRGLSGYSLGELVKTVGRQIGLLVVACASFSLLLAIHQLLFLLINGMVGSLPQWRVDSLWGVLSTLVGQTQTATATLDPNAGVSEFFGGNLPDSSGPFGMTWGQIFGGLGSFEGFAVSALVPIRFVAMFVAVTSAPLAILCFSTSLTRRLFYIWLQFWAEIEGLALGSAIVLAAYQQIAHKMGHVDPNQLGPVSPTEQAYILLGLSGLVGGANLVFLWKIIGQFLSNITSFYQQQYQRERQFWGVLAQAGVGIVGALATVATGGAALPGALIAEGLVSGATNLGATPGGGVPGAGVGQAFIGAGRAAATYQHQQAQEAEQAERNQTQEARFQTEQARKQDADQRSAIRGAMRQILPMHLRDSGDGEDTPGTAAGGVPPPSGGGNGSSYGGRAPFTGRGSASSQNGAHPPRWAAPPPAPPPTIHQVAGTLLREAHIDWEVRRDILAVLPDRANGLALVQAYAKAVQARPDWGQRGGQSSARLIDTLRQLAHPADQEGENDV